MSFIKDIFRGIAVICLLYGAIFSHTQMLYPPKRLNDNLKVAPCGGVPRGAALTVTEGDSLPIVWQEYINHPGWFNLYFSTGDENQFIEIAEIIDTLSDTATWIYDWVVPAGPCSTCILQVIQTMTNTNPPTFYHSCADVIISPSTTPVVSQTNFLKAPAVKSISSRELVWTGYPQNVREIRLLDSRGRVHRVVDFSDDLEIYDEVQWTGRPLGPGIYYLHVLGPGGNKLYVIQLNI